MSVWNTRHYVFLVPCKGTFKGKNDYIVSPYFPSSFKGAASCVYNIAVPDTVLLTIDFHKLKIDCQNDVFNIYNGHERGEGSLLYNRSALFCKSVTEIFRNRNAHIHRDYTGMLVVSLHYNLFLKSNNSGRMFKVISVLFFQSDKRLQTIFIKILHKRLDDLLRD